MKIIERFKAKAVLPRHHEPRWETFSEWAVCEHTEGLTQAECEEFLADLGYRQTADRRIYQLIDFCGASQMRIVDDIFDVASYNVALKD